MSTLQFKVIYMAADHAGFVYKNTVRDWLIKEGFRVCDMGADVYDEQDDFPLVMSHAAHSVVTSSVPACALFFGGSGQGEAMAGNRIKGIRATVYYGGDEQIVELSRTHNNANVLSFGARFVAIDDVKRLIWLWLHTPQSFDEKYTRRNRALDI